MRKLYPLIAILANSFSPNIANATNLLANGSFEQNGRVFMADFDTVNTTAITGWAITRIQLNDASIYTQDTNVWLTTPQPLSNRQHTSNRCA